MPPRFPLPALSEARPDLAGEAVEVVGRPDLAPGGLSVGSSRAVLWACPACATRWTAAVASRARTGRGCPTCARAVRGRSRAAVARGRTSAADRAPHLEAELVENTTRPGLGLRDVLPATRDRCRWRCAGCGHEWTASVSNRVAGRGCPSCANASRSARRAALRPGQTTASDAWPHLPAEFRRNLRRPGPTLADVASNSVDRCEWSCPECGHVYEATVANRGSKGSGCPRCAPARWAAARMRPRPGLSLAELRPRLAAQFVENVSRPGRRPDAMQTGVNDLVRWRCDRGHEWTTTVAARAGGSGCPRCGMSGLSRLELEVAALLAAATGAQVLTDVRVDAAGRTWRVDLAVETGTGRLLVDLDPQAWHQDPARDARKARALRDLDYVRVRPPGVPPLGPPARVVPLPPGAPQDPPAADWAAALARPLADRGLAYRPPGPQAAAAALARAARQWQDLTGAAPRVTAAAARPALIGEYVANTSRPGIGLGMLPPSARDRCVWRCAACAHEWQATVGSRCGSGRNAGQGTGCPRCAAAAGRERARAQALPAPGQSLADLHPAVAATLVDCLSAPGLTAADLRPASNRACLWRCDRCGAEYRTTVVARTSGRGCAACGRRAAGLARRRPPPGGSLADLHPGLAAEYAGCPGRPGASPADLAPGSNAPVDWRCGACGHRWTATPASRSAGGGCPPCARKRTVASRMRVPAGESLSELRPALAAQWHANATHPGRGPDALTCGSNDRCVWNCPACGGTWTATVKNRARHGTGCPACARGTSPPA